MRARNLCIFIFSILSFISLAQLPDGPYLGQEPPGSEPEIFAQGIISLVNRRETKIVFSPDGQECLIGLATGGAFKIFYIKQENGHWTEPKSADFLGNQDAREPFFFPDSNKIFFIRNADIWMCTRSNQTWATPLI